MLTSEGDKRVSGGEVARCEVTVGYRVLLLSQSLDDLETTWGECLGRTRWSSPLDWTTYLYYFYKWLYATNPQSHILLECSIVTWPCHVIWLLMFPHYLYLVFIVWLDICNQVFERMGNLFLLEALITVSCNSSRLSTKSQAWEEAISRSGYTLRLGWYPLLAKKEETCHDLAKRLSHYLYFFFFFFFFSFCGLTTTKWSTGRYHVTVSQYHRSQSQGVTWLRVTWGPWESKRIATVVKCISSREMSENSIEFSLSIAEQRAVGFISAWSLAFLH